MVPDSIIHRVVKMAMLPVEAAFTNVPYKGDEDREDGVIVSLKYFLLHENFIKPRPQEHIWSTFILTNAFKYMYMYATFPRIWGIKEIK